MIGALGVWLALVAGLNKDRVRKRHMYCVSITGFIYLCINIVARSPL
jgi:hypothetical protein